MAVDIRRLLNDNAHSGLVPVGQLYIIADAALGSAVSDIALHRLRVNAGRISHIRIAVRVAVGARHIVDEFISILNSHGKASPLFFGCRFFTGSGTFFFLLTEFCSHLVVSQREIGLLLQIQCGRSFS